MDCRGVLSLLIAYVMLQTGGSGCHIPKHLCCILGHLEDCLLFQHGTYCAFKTNENLLLIYLHTTAFGKKETSQWSGSPQLFQYSTWICSTKTKHRLSGGCHIFIKKRKKAIKKKQRNVACKIQVFLSHHLISKHLSSPLTNRPRWILPSYFYTFIVYNILQI